MTRRRSLIANLRNGALLVTLAAIPILVGFVWELAWGASRGVSAGTFFSLALAWLAGTGVVTGLALQSGGGANKTAWTYSCIRCGEPVYLFQYHCAHCGAKFVAPPEASAFRAALLLGVAVFYAAFALGSFLFRI